MNSLITTAARDTPIPGALYSVDDGAGHFGVAKVLAVDDAGVHIRLHKNKFATRPSRVEVSSLDLGSIHDPDGFGMGHMPLSYAAFSAWEPVFLEASALTEEELEGYRYWQEEQGGYFGRPGH
ncbi:hypothetical protein ACFQUU_22925 [Herbaspirillum sp. GCM10030257]|uniref:hypothetical protein n=1 Tax=Herbaspirillum sp. GCM10030257 TaxID=3273393 RepID=UPI00360AFD70